MTKEVQDWVTTDDPKIVLVHGDDAYILSLSEDYLKHILSLLPEPTKLSPARGRFISSEIHRSLLTPIQTILTCQWQRRDYHV